MLFNPDIAPQADFGQVYGRPEPSRSVRQLSVERPRTCGLHVKPFPMSDLQVIQKCSTVPEMSPAIRQRIALDSQRRLQAGNLQCRQSLRIKRHQGRCAIAPSRQRPDQPIRRTRRGGSLRVRPRVERRARGCVQRGGIPLLPRPRTKAFGIVEPAVRAPARGFQSRVVRDHARNRCRLRAEAVLGPHDRDEPPTPLFGPTRSRVRF